MEKLVIWTARVDYQQQKDELVLNTTIGSGTGVGKLFAPEWEMVQASKAGEITWEEYTAQYTELMRKRYRENRVAFRDVCRMGEIVLLCYCSRKKKGSKCHRYLLADILAKVAKDIGIEADYRGEVMTYTNRAERQQMRHARNKKRPLKR